MDKRVRAVENVETVNVAYRVKKAFQTVVAAGAILDANDIVVLRQLTRCLRRKGVTGAGGNVVKKERDAQRVGDRRIVVYQLFLLQGHEPRGNGRYRVNPEAGDLLAKPASLPRGNLPDVGYHRRATGGRLHAGSGDGDLLFLIEDKKLAVGAAAEYAVARGDLALHLLLQRWQVKGSLSGKGGNDGGEYAANGSPHLTFSC